MATIEINDVPDEVHAVLERRALAAGQSLQEHVLGLLVDAVRAPTLADIVAAVRDDRDSH